MSLSSKLDKMAIVRSMEDGSPDSRYLLDQNTGEILHLSSKTMSASELMSFQEKVKKEPDRYIPIPRTPSEEKLRDMELFAQQVVKDKKLQEKLVLALRGGNAFRPFMDAIDANPQEKENWKKFKLTRVSRRLEIFLKENGLL
jgi:hypothetical protein